MEAKQKPNYVSVDGIVAFRNKEPYIRLFANGQEIAQLTMAAARSFARDIERMCARTEADAMIHKFFARQEYPQGAATALMLEFREYRSALDAETVDKFEHDPDAGLGDKTN